MARRSRSSAQRDSSVISNLLHVPVSFGVPKVLRLLEDRREFNPDDVFRRARSVSRRDFSGIIDVGRSGGIGGSSRMPRSVFGFAVPDKVLICIRRKQRREVLFAKKRMRSGAGGSRRFNYYSAVSCGRRS